MPTAVHHGGRHAQDEHQGAHAHAGGPAIPFHKASYRYREKMRTDTVVGTTSQQAQQPIQITPGGFLAGIWAEISGAGGALGTAVLGSPSDWPFGVIANAQLEDVGGGTIYGPTSGYQLYLANKYGGYYEQSDPALAPGFTGTFAAPYFVIWVPLQIRSDALGALANTDARSQYRFVYTMEAITSGLLSTGTITTQPTFTNTFWVDYWAQVEAASLQGEPQEQIPPFLNTTQFWTREVPTVAAAAQTVKHNRVGNQIRTLIYELRNGAAAGAAQPANQRVNGFTDPIKIRLDNRYLFNGESPNLRRAIMGRDYDLTGADGDPNPIGTPVKGFRETGVLVYPFNKDSNDKPSPGDDADWLDTNEAQLLQFEDTLTGTVSTLNILTNDVAVRGPGVLHAPA